MPCPECGSSNIECDKKESDGAGTEWEEYACLDCGCEWEWEMARTITTHGNKPKEE